MKESGRKGTTGFAAAKSGSIASSASRKRALLSTPGSKHKKNDDVDEESRLGGPSSSSSSNSGYLESKYRKDNEEKLDALANSVTSIRNLSKNMGAQIEEEKKVQGQLDGGFLKTKEMV